MLSLPRALALSLVFDFILLPSIFFDFTLTISLFLSNFHSLMLLFLIPVPLSISSLSLSRYFFLFLCHSLPVSSSSSILSILIFFPLSLSLSSSPLKFFNPLYPALILFFSLLPSSFLSLSEGFSSLSLSLSHSLTLSLHTLAPSSPLLAPFFSIPSVPLSLLYYPLINPLINKSIIFLYFLHPLTVLTTRNSSNLDHSSLLWWKLTFSRPQILVDQHRKLYALIISIKSQFSKLSIKNLAGLDTQRHSIQHHHTLELRTSSSVLIIYSCNRLCLLVLFLLLGITGIYKYPHLFYLESIHLWVLGSFSLCH